MKDWIFGLEERVLSDEVFNLYSSSSRIEQRITLWLVSVLAFECCFWFIYRPMDSCWSIFEVSCNGNFKTFEREPLETQLPLSFNIPRCQADLTFMSSIGMEVEQSSSPARMSQGPPRRPHSIHSPQAGPKSRPTKTPFSSFKLKIKHWFKLLGRQRVKWSDHGYALPTLQSGR